LNNTSDKRKNKRYDISEYVKEDYFDDIRLEIKTDNVFTPRLMDISINGLGLELEESDPSIDLNEFNRISDYFINIHFVDKVILAEVKKIWSIIVEDTGKKILKGGFLFSVISPEDKLSLAEHINALRK
jgi:hypothetical protein